MMDFKQNRILKLGTFLILIKVSLIGNLKGQDWTLKIDHGERDFLHDMMVISNENYFIAGRSNLNSELSNPYIASVSSQGEINWEKGWEEFGGGNFYDIDESDGVIYAVGRLENPTRLFCIAIEKDGNVLWEHEYAPLDNHLLIYGDMSIIEDQILVNLTPFNRDEQRGAIEFHFLNKNDGKPTDTISFKDENKDFTSSKMAFDGESLFHVYELNNEFRVAKRNWPDLEVTDWVTDKSYSFRNTKTVIVDNQLVVLGSTIDGFDYQGIYKIFNKETGRLNHKDSLGNIGQSHVVDIFEKNDKKWLLVDNNINGKQHPLLVLYNEEWVEKERIQFRNLTSEQKDQGFHVNNLLGSTNNGVIIGGNLTPFSEDDDMFITKVNVNPVNISLKPEVKKKVAVYPNPFQEKVNILSSDVSLERIDVFDLRGREIFNLQVPNRNKYFLGMNDLQGPGPFLLLIHLENGETKRKMLNRKK